MKTSNKVSRISGSTRSPRNLRCLGRRCFDVGLLVLVGVAAAWPGVYGISAALQADAAVRQAAGSTEVRQVREQPAPARVGVAGTTPRG